MKALREFTLDVEVAASKEKVWDTLFNRFGEVNDFNPLIIGSRRVAGNEGEVGVERTCDLDAKTQVREKITHAVGHDSFDLEIIEGGLPMMDKMIASFSLDAINQERTNVAMTFKYNTSPAFMGGILKSTMAKTFFKLLVGLKYHLETGELVTKENIKQIMQHYKQLEKSARFEHLELVTA